jgi:hypothetical protein
MSEEEGSEHTPGATPSRSVSPASGEEQSGTPATQNAGRQHDCGPLLPHQLIPAHIKDKEKIDVSASDAATAVNHMFCQKTCMAQLMFKVLHICIVGSVQCASAVRMAERWPWFGAQQPMHCRLHTKQWRRS